MEIPRILKDIKNTYYRKALEELFIFMVESKMFKVYILSDCVKFVYTYSCEMYRLFTSTNGEEIARLTNYRISSSGACRIAFIKIMSDQILLYVAYESPNALEQKKFPDISFQPAGYWYPIFLDDNDKNFLRKQFDHYQSYLFNLIANLKVIQYNLDGEASGDANVDA